MPVVSLYDDCEVLPQYGLPVADDACAADDSGSSGGAEGVDVGRRRSTRALEDEPQPTHVDAHCAWDDSSSRQALREVVQDANTAPVYRATHTDCRTRVRSRAREASPPEDFIDDSMCRASTIIASESFSDIGSGFAASSLTPSTDHLSDTRRDCSLGKGDTHLDCFSEEVWENQRWMVLRGWGAPSAMERSHFSDKSGTRARLKEALLLPYGWDWTGEWSIDRGSGGEGWHYASDFTKSISRCREQAGKIDMVRRRRWWRVRVPVAPDALHHKVVTGRTGGRYWAQCESYGFQPHVNPPPATYRRVMQKRNHVATTMWQAVFQNKSYEKVLKNGERSRLRPLVRKHGIPAHLRGRVWSDISGASRKKRENHGYYKCVVESLRDDMPWDAELDKDLPRTFADHPYFAAPNCPGRMKLRRVLSALSYRNPLVNYCQSFNFIAACMLLNTGEETTFWLLISLLENTLPNDYYNAHLVGITVDLRVIGDLIDTYCAALAKHFRDHQLDITPFMAGWLMNLYVGVFPIDVTMRIWDILFCEGPKIIFRIVIGLLKVFEADLLRMDSLGEILEFLTQSCKRMHDATELLREGLNVRLADAKLMKLRESHRQDVKKEVDMRNLISRTDNLSPTQPIDPDLLYSNMNDSWVSLDGFLTDDEVCGS